MVLQNFLFFLTAFAGTMMVVALALIIGRAGCALLRLRCETFPEEVACSIAAGLGTLSLATFLLGICGLLLPGFLALTIAALVVGSLALWRRVRRSRESPRRVQASHLLIAALILLSLLPLLLLPLYPPTAPDAVTYHLAVAREYAGSGSVHPTPQYRYAVFPQGAEMLFTGALMTGGDILAQSISLIFLLVTALAVVAFAGHRGHGVSAAWGAALLLSNSAVLALAGVALADMALMAFVTLAVLSFERWHESGDDAWLLYSGLMAGCAAGTKYSALFFPPVLALLAIVLADGRRRLRAPFIFIVSCGIAAMPWYLYNAYHTGNPVWPFFSSLFGHAYWSDADVTGQTADLLTAHGTGTSLPALLSLPWNLFKHPEYFHAEGVLSVSMLIGIPFALYEIAGRGYARMIALVGASYGLFWFSTAQILRYLLPVLPLLCVLSSAGMSRVFERFFPSRRTARLSAVVVVAVLIILPGWLFALRTVASLGPPPVTPEVRIRFLEKHIPAYAALRYLESRVGSSYTLYSYGEPRLAYFTKGAFRGDHFGPWRYSRVSGLLADREADLLRELSGMGIDYLLVRDDPAGSECPPDWLLRQHVVPVFRVPGIALFAVRSVLQEPVRDPGDMRPPSITPEGKGSEGVRFAARGGDLYYSSCAAKQGGSAGTVVFQAAWLREDGTRIRTDETTGVFSPDGDTLRMLSTAPAGTSSALLACAPLDSGGIAVESFSFRKILFAPVTP